MTWSGGTTQSFICDVYASNGAADSSGPVPETGGDFRNLRDLLTDIPLFLGAAASWLHFRQALRMPERKGDWSATGPPFVICRFVQV